MNYLQNTKISRGIKTGGALLFRVLGVVCFLFLGIFFAVALFSYSPTDPSLNTAISNAIPKNIGGFIGANTADILYQIFGLSALIMPIFFLVWTVHFWRKTMRFKPLLYIPLWIITLMMISSLISFIGTLKIEATQVPAGGMFGLWVYDYLIKIKQSYSTVFVISSIVIVFLVLIGAYFSLGIAGLKGINFKWAGLIVLIIKKPFVWLYNIIYKAYDLIPQSKSSLTPLIIKSNSIEDDIASIDEPVSQNKKEKRQSIAKNHKKSNFTYSADNKFILPHIDLLTLHKSKQQKVDPKEIMRASEALLQVLSDFGVKGDIVGANSGPVVTMYEFEPAPGIKSSRIIGLADDIARSMSALSARVAVVTGRNVIGIELPNPKRETVYLRDVFEHKDYQSHANRLPLALGKDINGSPIIVDLAKMPHLLVAGTTGSGKSVAVNTMILSLMYSLPPEKCRFIMVDPKMLELSIYDDIPHLLTPVVTDPKKAVIALKWAVKEMEQRYQAMSRLAVRNIEGYNSRINDAAEKGEILHRRVQTGFDRETGKPVFEDQVMPLEKLPYIVVIVDEMADLMLVAGKDIETAIQRLAQMARAAGIHLIMATQRPSVDVITGTIKANFPVRISFQVTSKIDSRTILGEMGAEQLLGQGDMLYMAGGGRITRVHGPFVSDSEVEAVVSYLKSQGQPDYVDNITVEDDDEEGATIEGGGSGDAMYDQAVAIIMRERKVSTSFIQRHLQIGYNRAARIIEKMEAEGIISQPNHAGKREILAP